MGTVIRNNARIFPLIPVVSRGIIDFWKLRPFVVHPPLSASMILVLEYRYSRYYTGNPLYCPCEQNHLQKRDVPVESQRIASTLCPLHGPFLVTSELQPRSR